MSKITPSISMSSSHKSDIVDSLANPLAIVLAGGARFTVLADRLIRCEYAPDGQFEDRATHRVWYNRLY